MHIWVSRKEIDDILSPSAVIYNNIKLNLEKKYHIWMTLEWSILEESGLLDHHSIPYILATLPREVRESIHLIEKLTSNIDMGWQLSQELERLTSSSPDGRVWMSSEEVKNLHDMSKSFKESLEIYDEEITTSIEILNDFKERLLRTPKFTSREVVNAVEAIPNESEYNSKLPLLFLVGVFIAAVIGYIMMIG